LRKAKNRISVLDEGDMRPDQVKLLAERLGVAERNVIDMNRRLGGDASLNAPIREDGDSGDRQDWLVDDAPGTHPDQQRMGNHPLSPYKISHANVCLMTRTGGSDNGR